MGEILMRNVVSLVVVLIVGAALGGLIQEANLHRQDDPVKIREWPWDSWLHGPPCPKRHQQQYLPIDVTSSNVTLGLDEVNLLVEATIQDLKDLGIDCSVSVSIVYDQQTLLSKGYGVKNLHTNEPADENTIYNVGSVTKVFTSLAMFQSIQNQQVNLNDPVTKYFNAQSPPVFNIHNPYSSKGADVVTLESLAAQSSGLPREPFCGVYPLTASCANQSQAAESNFQALSEFGLLFPPFTGSHYSNLGLAILGRCLERAWGQQYEDYMVNHIFTPLGMKSSGFEYTSDVIDQMAVGYMVEGPVNGTYIMIPSVQYNHQPMEWAAPCGGMYSSVADMANFFQWMFARNDSQEFDQTTLDSFLLTPGAYLPDGISMYGRGTWESFYANGYWTITKGGLAAAMAASISMVPQLKLGVAVMTNINSGSTMDSLGAKINDILVPVIENAISQAQQKVPLPQNYQQWIGSYGFSTPLVIMNAPNDDSGVLTGYVFGPGNVHFIWDQNQNYNGRTSFRYSSISKIHSCMYETSLGDNAIAYFDVDRNNRPYVLLADENFSLYYLPMMD